MPDPVDAIMQVMQSAFPPAYGEAWTRRQVSDALTFAHTHYILAPVPGEIDLPGDAHVHGEMASGFVLSRHAADEEELLLLAVSPQYRGQGIGRQLLLSFFANAKERGVSKLFLEMRDGNPAEHLYRHAGFVEVGRRKGYYRGAVGGPIDAITFGRDI